MEKLEKVEKLREKTGVSYDEAKSALEACNYDVLDALVYLEKLGKVNDNNIAVYTTERTTQSNEFSEAQKSYQDSCKENSVGDVVNKLLEGCRRLFKKGCETFFIVRKHDNNVLRVPVIILVAMLIFAFWITIPVLIVGLCCECKYSFEGFASTKVDINELCDKASEACENIKNDIKSTK